jgi:hypothetical protein
MSDKKQELLELSKRAALSSELAVENIKKYELLHQGDLTSAAGFNMKALDASDAELKAVVDISAKAAINNLQRYLDLLDVGQGE